MSLLSKNRCEICNGAFKEYYTGPVRNGHQGTIDSVVYRCKGCGVLRLRESDCLNEEDYRTVRYRKKLGEPVTDRFHLDDPYQLDRLKVIGTNNLRGKSVLDFGAGSGSFCDHIAGLAKVEAFEINRVCVMDIRERGIPAWYDFQWLGVEKFDMITSFLVIEHLEEPMKWHRKLWDYIKDGGELIIQTPMQAAYESNDKYFRKQHRWYWDLKSMEKFISQLTPDFYITAMLRSHMQGMDVWVKARK